MPTPGPSWHMLIPLTVIVLAAIGGFLLARFFARPVDVSALGSAGIGDATPLSPPEGSTPIEQDAFVVIPDISGYTRFMRLNRFAAGHAQFVVAQLLDSIITAARPTLSPTRVEGDSVMFHAVSERADAARGTSGATLAASIQELVGAFYRKRAALRAGNLCPCEACQHITDLDIKVVVHRGDIVRYTLHGLEDLSGLAVIEAHRLLKNSVNQSRYVLVSRAAAADVSLAFERAPGPHQETYDGIGEMSCDLYLIDDRSGVDDGLHPSRVSDMTGKLINNAQALTGGTRHRH